MNTNTGTLSFSVLNAFVIRHTDGTLDFDSTMQKFATRVTEYDAAVSMETEKIGAAVHAVFDSHPIVLGMDYITDSALPMLNPTPDNHLILKDRIKDYIRSNSDHGEIKHEDGTATPSEKPGTRLFAILRGKGGGVKRWSDHASKPE
jgi:hypothetical protein